ncbi:MAG TPA: dihydrolipoamide acetyltransferase family protein [Gemmatimonadales bacterium]|nr:dihydrolipoamide acetyltransferase family protein [Gemmatimonadales bacterium]
MARVDVVMPQMGESIVEGTVSKWLKQLGETVKRDEPLFEISTDKVDAEIPSPAAGVLAEIKVQQGQTVPIQTLVAVIETEVTSVSSAPAPRPAAPAPGPASEAPSPLSPPPARPRAPEAGQSPAPTPAPPSAPPRSEPASVSAADRLRERSTPLVRKIAAEHQVDVAAVPGTGVAGRVTKQDILSFIATAQPPRAPVPAAPEAPAVEPWPGDRVEPFTRIRKITAEHMVMSRRISAHVTSFFEVDFTTVATLRAKHRAAYSERGINLTFLGFIAKACADTLTQHPVINAAVSGESIIYRREINLGIAVALDWGLLVPVIKHANELSLQGIARAINDLGERARTKKLAPDEIQRGTFTITNPGVFGSFAGAPIINQPQVAILDVGAIEKRPKVVTLPDGGDALAIRTMGMISLSYDHRVVDGATADRFLADVKKTLQSFPEAAL